MKRIFITPGLCDGCKNCSLACMEAHRRDGGQGIYTLDLLDPENISRNRIVLSASGGYDPIFCRHCDDPDCAAACMSGALRKSPETGLVDYDEDRCAACFMCVMSCRYGVPAISPDRTRMVKCDLCQHLPEGPACVRACPKGAIELREV